MAKAALACAAFLASGVHADMGGDLMFGDASDSALGVSELLIAELERELRNDASVLEEFDPLFKLRKLTGSYDLGDLQQPGFSFGFSYSMSFSMSVQYSMDYSFSFAAKAPTETSVPTSFPTKGCGEGEIFSKLFFGPLDDPWDPSTVALIQVDNGASTPILFELRDISYYMPICLPPACLKISTTAAPNEDRFVKIQTAVDTVAFFGTDFTFCLDETGEISRAPSRAPTAVPTAAPTAALTQPPSTRAPSMSPTQGVSTVKTLFLVSYPPLFSDAAAARFTSGFCLAEAYSAVVDDEVAKSYKEDSPFITLSFLEGAFSSRAAPDAAEVYGTRLPVDETYVEIFATVDLLNTELVVRSSAIDTVGKAELKIENLFNKESILQSASWNAKVSAKIDPTKCATYDATLLYFKENEPAIFSKYFSDVQTLSDNLLQVIELTEVVIVVVESETFAPTTAPSSSPAPSFAPTLTSMPTSTLAPTAAVTSLVCTQTDECPGDLVCCASDPTNRRSLLFGSVYGICKVSC
ncbi:hypothetical protein M885DRAFT_513190 [Pelagophyceae sp. CCMP2097]|nr:hypothetical protein M885DRAFT_513190 [Pelagophyceae sp. CCMP2097]|eukprot:CAMPEP_0184101956 /NCGR_PEP_ID=MMETSP0974-20121125/13099_1 /TAXON_ID=483370 /ORGANISM="non described non described, Strain CCMP2097" /LENGTH=523 /DNA_ID=CAMNT_0026404899 /DNA_START=22 /DNA_END=1593 /DNA_ORIENTATION=+